MVKKMIRRVAVATMVLSIMGTSAAAGLGIGMKAVQASGAQPAAITEIGGARVTSVRQFTAEPDPGMTESWLSRLAGGTEKPVNIAMGRMVDGSQEFVIRIRGEQGEVVWLANSGGVMVNPSTGVREGESYEFVSYKTLTGGKAEKNFTELADLVYVKILYGVSANSYTAIINPAFGSLGSKPDENTPAYRSYVGVPNNGPRKPANPNAAVFIEDTGIEEGIRTGLRKESGPITEQDMASLTNLSINWREIRSLQGLEYAINLRSLDLSNNNIVDLSSIGKLKQLKDLNVSGNAIRSLEPLAGLMNLQALDVSNNRIQSLEPLRSLTGLKSLQLAKNEWSDPAPLAALTGLNRLDISNNLVGDITLLGQLRSLEHLYLNGIRKKELPFLERLTRLKTLELKYNNLTHLRWIKSLNHLRSIDLSGNLVEDSGPLLDLAESQLNSSGVASLMNIKLLGNPLSANSRMRLEGLKNRGIYIETSPETKVLPLPSSIQVVIDGRTLAADQPPGLENGRVLVPLRGIFEELGLAVEWEPKTRTIKATGTEHTIQLTIEKQTADVNGKKIKLDQPAVIRGERAMVPVRFIAEAAGAQVYWEPNTRTVLIESRPESLSPDRTLTPIAGKATMYEDRFGYVDSQGKLVIPLQFQNAAYFSEGLAAVKTSEGRAGYINSQGTFVIPAEYYWANSFSEGLAAVQDLNSQLYGFIDKKGHMVIPPSFEWVDSFHNGYAAVSKNIRDGGMYYIDRQGNPVTGEIFAFAGSYREGLAIVQTLLGEWMVLDRTGRVINYPGLEIMGYRYFHEGVTPGGIFYSHIQPYKYGLMNKQGVVTKLAYDWINPVQEGLAPALLNGKWGYLDREGQVAIPIQFDDAREFSEGLAAVRQNGLYGFIDISGKYALSARYTDVIRAFRNGLAVVRLDGKLVLINKNGDVVHRFDLFSNNYYQ